MLGPAVPFDQVEDASRYKAPHRATRGLHREAHPTRQPGNRESELGFAFEPAVPEKMRVDGAVGPGKMEPRREQIFILFPHQCRIKFFVFHVCSPEWESRNRGVRANSL